MSAELNSHLSQAFEFSEEDLLANRKGTITTGQKKKLDGARKARLFSLISYAVITGLFVLASIGGSFYMLMTHQDPTIRITIPLAIGFATLIVLGAALNHFLRTRDILAGTVSKAQGQAHLFTRNLSSEDISWEPVGL